MPDCALRGTGGDTSAAGGAGFARLRTSTSIGIWGGSERESPGAGSHATESIAVCSPKTTAVTPTQVAARGSDDDTK